MHLRQCAMTNPQLSFTYLSLSLWINYTVSLQQLKSTQRNSTQLTTQSDSFSSVQLQQLFTTHLELNTTQRSQALPKRGKFTCFRRAWLPLPTLTQLKQGNTTYAISVTHVGAYCRPWMSLLTNICFNNESQYQIHWMKQCSRCNDKYPVLVLWVIFV